jgi:hypothetical protein
VVPGRYLPLGEAPAAFGGVNASGDLVACLFLDRRIVD